MGEMVLIFNHDGSVKKATRGFKGKSCVDKTKFMEDALGTAAGRQYTQEYYEDEQKYKNKETN